MKLAFIEEVLLQLDHNFGPAQNVSCAYSSQAVQQHKVPALLHFRLRTAVGSVQQCLHHERLFWANLHGVESSTSLLGKVETAWVCALHRLISADHALAFSSVIALCNCMCLSISVLDAFNDAAPSLPGMRCSSNHGPVGSIYVLMTSCACCAAGPTDKVFERIFLIEQTGDPDMPYRKRNLTNVPQKDIAGYLRPLGVIALLSVSDIPEDLAALNSGDQSLPFLSTADLEDGGEYLLIYQKLELDKQVGTHLHVQTMTC